ncbi:hypothetical protein SRB5_10780 [Streptomyces sp. RB5]|uniref:Uncharacterized protein n=2 Tax=Streptomyces smaragdinus TaxID=2585196 RepID=A0A7K0CDW5_9ACTN|nr:hypothetical protein [Streptomyces smaragdinus]
MIFRSTQEKHMPSRTRRMLAVCTTLLALAAYPAVASTAAAAPPSPASVPQRAQIGLPPIGAEIPMSMFAVNSPMRIGADLVSVDFRGGIRQRVEVNPEDPFRSVRLRTVGFRVTAEISDEAGTVTIEQNDIDVEASSKLTLTQQFPPRYEHVISVPVTVTIDRPDGDPLVLTATKPMVMVADIRQFPPRGDQYRLREPVDFAAPDDPEKTEATLEQFPARVGGL